MPAGSQRVGLRFHSSKRSGRQARGAEVQAVYELTPKLVLFPHQDPKLEIKRSNFKFWDRLSMN